MLRAGTVALSLVSLLVVPWQPPTEPTLRAAAAEEASKGPNGLPMTGKAVKLLDPVDAGIEKIMLRHGIPGAAVAITRHGKLIFTRGYGWSHHLKNVPATPETLFGLASVSKVFTALAVLALVEDGKLKLDQKAFALLPHLRPLPRVVPDPRLANVTVRQLLNHSGGWDREKSGDPINWSQQVALALKVRLPINEDQLIRYTLAARLDFDPGTRTAYSNFGYVVLGQIIARVSGDTYENFVQSRVLRPMGITRIRMHDRGGQYFETEARRYNAGNFTAMPAYNSPWTDASGGWAASAVDLARVMTAIDGSRTGKPFLGKEMMQQMLAPPPPPIAPRPDRSYFGLGWDVVVPNEKDHGYVKSGAWPGVRASVKHRIDGINTVVLYNAIVQMEPIDMRIVQDAAREIRAMLDDVKAWPEVDLFPAYR